ncbi:hypothetical protein GCM10023161_13700 [Mycobacterium paraffinicum]|uniref:Secreted protein n=1 Tax=Mycobacterium paraffinicum TaxID=53378 RepID=A0ABP8RG03_9MYCO
MYRLALVTFAVRAISRMVAREYPAVATQRMVAATIRRRVSSPLAPTGRPRCARVTVLSPLARPVRRLRVPGMVEYNRVID